MRAPRQQPDLFGREWYENVTNASYEQPERVASGIFSECEEHQDCTAPYCTGRRYRYQLHIPTGVDNNRKCLWVLANPSTATPDKLDPTIRRCVNWSRDWGFGWCWVCNVRAWRETHPGKVPEDPRAIGPTNDTHIYNACLMSDLIVCGWGQLGGARGIEVLELIRSTKRVPHGLKFAKDGAPYHPLYLPNDSKPIAMSESADRIFSALGDPIRGSDG